MGAACCSGFNIASFAFCARTRNVVPSPSSITSQLAKSCAAVKTLPSAFKNTPDWVKVGLRSAKPPSRFVGIRPDAKISASGSAPGSTVKLLNSSSSTRWRRASSPVGQTSRTPLISPSRSRAKTVVCSSVLEPSIVKLDSFSARGPSLGRMLRVCSTS